MVEGIPSRVAFEATDAYGNPIALSGTVINREKKEIASFATVHEGRGTFVYTPTNGENHKAEVELNGKKYRFDLPEARLQGYALQVDNLSSEDSIAVSVQKNPHTPESVLGLAVLGHGKLLNYCLLNIRKIHLSLSNLTRRNGRQGWHRSYCLIQQDRLLPTALSL